MPYFIETTVISDIYHNQRKRRGNSSIREKAEPRMKNERNLSDR